MKNLSLPYSVLELIPKYAGVIRWRDNYWVTLYRSGDAVTGWVTKKDHSYPVKQGEQLVVYSRYVAGVWWKAEKELPKKKEKLPWEGGRPQNPPKLKGFNVNDPWSRNCLKEVG